MLMALSQANRDFEASVADPAPDVWGEWLWGCDLAEAVTVDSLLNKSHLLGLLIARYRALREPELMDVCVTLPNMTNQNCRVSTMSPRQVKDVVEDLQMHWPRYADEVDPEALAELVDACMCRFGYFNLHPTTYDDVGMRDPDHPDRMTVNCMRRMVSIMCVLYRHLDLMHRSVDPPTDAPGMQEQIQDFHVQSSLDSFYQHSMHSDLPPAARVLYRQDFTGFYHCVSQVVYYHFQDYERRPQADIGLIRTGDSAIHTLAPVMEMYPDIHLCYEDECLRPGEWNWVLMGKRVYLVDAQSDVVYFSPNLLKLMAAYFRQCAPRGGSCPEGTS
jgi:hypothetical protein